MLTWVMYDIPKDKIRNKIAEVCKDYGLERIQWSAFSGGLSSNRREELHLKFIKTLKNKEGNIQIFPICSKDISLKKEINNGVIND